MKWTYDPQADAIYVTLQYARLKNVTVSLADAEVHLDVDGITGEILGIEILGAGAVFTRLSKLLAEPPKILGGEGAG